MPVARPSQHPAGRLEFANPANKAWLSRLTKAGRAIRLASGTYAVDNELPAEQVALHHRFSIVARFWPGAVLCDRTALRGGEPDDGWMFVCHPDPPRSASLRLPGLTVAVRIGPGPLPGDMPFPEGLYLSGPARTLVENVDSAGRPSVSRAPRAAGTPVVEDRIDSEARTGGPGRISALLAALDVISGAMPAPAVSVVRARLAALLGTSLAETPRSGRLAARLAGQPYDEHRLDMLATFVDYLGTVAPAVRPAHGGPQRWAWLPFYEAYFSNFIEGTEFGVDEARRIAVDGASSARPQDAHDITATFRLTSDSALSSANAHSPGEFVEMLAERHAALLAARPEKRPGQFKELPNFAGGYAFVSPEAVLGTLHRGFDMVAQLADPFHRAVAMMLLVTEVHPFDDGNGRLARLVSNAELSAAGQVRIVVPTVYRNNYLAGLSGVSNGAGRGETLHSVLDFAQKWTSVLDWRTYETADANLRAVDAFMDAGLAEAGGVRLRLPI